GLNILLIPSYSIVGAAITTLISEVIVTVLSIIKGRNYCDISIKRKNIFSVFIGTILICLVCIFSKFIIYNYIIRLIVSILVSIIIYYIVLRIMKNDLAIKK
ncbi:polysaccharide biosynthesis C-terminal domain-containing protein, partial [Enterococcus faecium]|nr:polysaccharide biosynthesis C-terminal domain-containing protein [Enterococcus faecium]